MNGEWCYFKSRYDKSTCEHIISLAESMPSQAAMLGLNTNPIENNDIRRSEIRFVNSDDDRFKWLFDDLWKMVIQANKDFFNFHISHLDFIQIAKYDSSYLGEYKSHHDVFWLNGDQNYHRKLSCIIQLSDPNDYDGGDFEINEATHSPDYQELKSQGTVIFFPSFLRHQAHKVIRGTRYSIAAWFEGPKWR